MEKQLAFAKLLFRRIMEDDVFGRAAQLAYFFLLSLFPFLLFLLTLIGYFPIDEQSVIELIATYAPAQIGDLLHTNIGLLLNQQNGGLLSISIIGALWAGSNGVNALIRAFNKAYSVEEDRPFIVARLIAIVLTIAMVVIIIIAFLLPIFGRMIGIHLFSLFGLSANFISIWETLRWLISSIIFFIVFLALYKLAPNTKVEIKNVVWGALFATVFWQLVSLGFSYYVNTMGNYSATYGSLGAVIVLMIWFYISGIIIMIGGTINAAIKQAM